MQQLLQAGEVPRRLRGIGRVHRIGELLERGLPDERDGNQHDGERFDGDDLSKQQIAVGEVFSIRQRKGRGVLLRISGARDPLGVDIVHAAIFVKSPEVHGNKSDDESAEESWCAEHRT